MRILEITPYKLQNNVAFGHKNKKHKAKYLTEHKNTFASNLDYCGNYNNNYLLPKDIKGQHPYSEGYFNMDKLLQIEIPKSEKQKPKPFELSDGLLNLDKYQKDAIDAYNSGKSTIVSAPTGTGKTLIAEHVIKNTLDKNKKIIYLSPLKALSNEKYSEFAKLFGTYDAKGNLQNTDNVGLVTGDRCINPDAPLVVMTTEVYKNSLLSTDEKTVDKKYKDYDGVIFDEFHYLNDKDRGTVWEEAVMYTPKHMKQLMLSATASNASSIQEWINDINGQNDTYLVSVPEQERHVPLREFCLLKDQNHELKLINTKIHKIDVMKLKQEINLSDRQYDALNELGNIIGSKTKDDTINYLSKMADRNMVTSKVLSKHLQNEYGIDEETADAISLILSNNGSTVYLKDMPAEYDFDDHINLGRVVKILNDKNMTPVLVYKFSKKGCDKSLEKISADSPSLLNPVQSKMVYDEVQTAIDKGVFLGSDFNEQTLEALMKGYAVHHAGKLPAYKSLVESLARKGLVKVCFATETLLAGINMPFKSSVFTALNKFDGDEIVDISTSIFKQGAGRAGRRGKDKIGNVVVLPYNYEEYLKYIELSSSKDTSIKSQYKPSYASVLSDRMLNDKEGAILSSFASQQSSKNIDRLEELTNSRLENLERMGYIEKKKDGTYKRTYKGEIAKSVYGINEIIMTELIAEPEYLKDFTSVELTALCAMFSDVKDENPEKFLTGEYSYLSKPFEKICDLVDDIDKREYALGIREEETKLSTNLVPYILRFAELSNNSRTKTLEGWTEIMNELRENDLIVHEGDFLRVINGTIDLLKIINELTPDENIKKESEIAISNLRKPPVVDIFNLELNMGI